jgi:hypothetical protein
MAPIMFSGGRELCWILAFLGNRIRTIIITINEAELRKNTAQGAIAVTTKPPTVGPTARPILLATALRVRAAGSCDLGTSPLMVGIIGVLIIVVPAPSAKVISNNTDGVVMPTRVSTPRIIDIANMYAHVMRSILRRSKISEIAPDGKAKIKIGRVLAVVIRETNKGFGASEVINHEAPTSYIAAPIYEKSAAVHNVLYKLYLNGFRPDAEIFSSCSLFRLSTIENK